MCTFDTNQQPLLYIVCIHCFCFVYRMNLRTNLTEGCVDGYVYDKSQVQKRDSFCKDRVSVSAGLVHGLSATDPCQRPGIRVCTMCPRILACGHIAAWLLKYILNEEFMVHLFTIQLCSVFAAKMACISAFRNKNRSKLSCKEHILQNVQSIKNQQIFLS